MVQTVIQWFNLLPEPYKSQSLSNILIDRQDNMCESMSHAIDRGMGWSDTPQGHKYWADLRDIYLDAESNSITDYEDAIRQHKIKEAERLARIVVYSDSMKEMLNKLSDDCRVSRVLVNGDWVNNSFCNYITTRNGMLSYLPNGREHKVNEETGRWLRDGRQEMKPAKLARRLMIESKLSECDDADFEKFGNKVRAYLGIVGDEDGEGRNIRLEIISGESIRNVYHHSSYSRVLGDGTNLHGSCMRSTDAQDYFGIYEKNDDVIQMLVAKDNDGKVLGRALLWTFDNGEKGMDTVYGANIIEQVMKEWAIDNAHYYKSSQSCHHHNFDMFNGGSVSGDDDKFRKVIIKQWDFDNYPYVDSMYLIGRDEGVYYLCNKHKSGLDLFRTLRCTDGRYDEQDNDDDDYVTLENGDRCYTDDAYYLDYRAHNGDRISGYYHESEVVYTMCGEHYLREHCTRVDGNWYTLDDDNIAYVEDRDDYFLSENTVYCEVREIRIHEDDAVCLADGNYCDRDEAFECAYNGEWYIKLERVIATDGELVYEGNLEPYLELIKKETNETERETTTA